MHLAAQKLSKQYKSDVIGLKLGKEKIVIVMKYDLVKEVLTRDDFNNRPDNFFMRLRCMGTRKGKKKATQAFVQCCFLIPKELLLLRDQYGTNIEAS